MLISGRSQIVLDLFKTGLIPQNCKRFELVIEENSTIRMRLDIYVEEAQLRKLADALRDNPKEAEELARTIVFRSSEFPELSPTVEVEIE